MLYYFHIPIGWWELLKRTFRDTYADNCLGLAAQLAFYFFLALVPALLFFVSLLSLLPIQNVMDELLRTLGQFAPPEVLAIIREQIQEIASGDATGILTFAIVGTIWSSSAAMNAIIETVNRAYDIQDSRPFWKTRSLAILLTIALAVFVIVSLALVLMGPQLIDRVADRIGLGPAARWSWMILQWPVVFLLVSTGFGLVYCFAPDAEQDWVWITPGSAFSTMVWLITSLLFRFYVTSFGSYNATYGTLGGIVVMMLWFYLTGLAILIGAEMNAEIEHLSPYGKDPGEKKKGQRRMLGAAAARAYTENAEIVHAAIVSDEGPNCAIDLPPPPAKHSHGARPSELLIGGLVLAPLAYLKIRDALKQNGQGSDGDRPPTSSSTTPRHPDEAHHPIPNTPASHRKQAPARGDSRR